MHCLSSVYFVSQPLHVSGIFVPHHQEAYCIYTTGKCYTFQLTVCWPTDIQLKSKTRINYCIQGVPRGMCQTSGGCSLFKLYRYNPKHLCPKLNDYGDNGQGKVWSSCGSTHCTFQQTILSISVLECGVI